MKPFSMESVLNHRVQLEKQAQQNLFADIKQEAKTKQQVDLLKNELNSLQNELARKQQQGIRVESLLLIENWISSRQELFRRARIQLEKLSEKVLQSRKKLIETSREKKILEKLKKKQNNAYRYYIEKKETATLDEISVLRYNR